MKRNWFARHPIGFMALYFLLYLSAFNFLETQISMPRVLLVHCRLDDLIPFCKYAIVPYFAWFAWIPFTLFYLLWKAPREDFWRLCLPLFGGMTIALACYVILPTGLDLRPYYVPGTDLFARAVRMLYRTDTATNVCPSIHVFNSVTLMLAYHRCRLFEEPRRRWMRPAADVLCFSIVCSTMLLKQHSCIDVVLGALLALVSRQGYINCYALITEGNLASEEFHKALGFEPAARLECCGYKMGQWLNLCYYHLALSARPQAPAKPVPLSAVPAEQAASVLRRASMLVKGAGGH